MISLGNRLITRILLAVMALLLIEVIVPINLAQNCEPKTISNMDGTTGWNTYTDGEIGSTMVLNSVAGVKNFGIEMAFNLNEGGWVGISRKIKPDTLLGTTGIKFSYRGKGERENLELKLIDLDGTNFGLKWSGATVTDDWVTIEVPYSDCQCLWCNEEKSLDINRVDRIEFAISNDVSRVPGPGSVTIDEVQGMTC